MDTIPLKTAVTRAGSQKALADLIDRSQQVISKWLRQGGKVPAEAALKIEAATGVSRHALRPDIFGATPKRARAA